MARSREMVQGACERLQGHTQHVFALQSGQGNVSENSVRDLRAELLAAEAAHFAKTNGTTEDAALAASPAPKRALEAPSGEDDGDAGDAETKRRKILEETRDIDADSGSSDSDSSEEEDSDDDEEDETAELMRELEKIKRERAEKKAQEDAEKAAQEQEQKEHDIALGNPLLNPKAFNMKRRWDDDVIFKNQARGTENKGRKEFVNVGIAP
ncbi:MAG: hypothetical protein Q9160_003736 [Pyrenula sp. 1 TL-2023]